MALARALVMLRASCFSFLLSLTTTLLGGCLDTPDDAAVTTSVASDLLASPEVWSCYQHCNNGTIMGGHGGSVDEAWQTMSGCGAGGGGAIECSSSNDL
jgi:hypothetical protein